MNTNSNEIKKITFNFNELKKIIRELHKIIYKQQIQVINL